jgi:hypothetical protein
MGSLNAHLRQPAQHARLPFHSECPICRDERLVGTLPPVNLIPPRGSAALAAGLLAMSAIAPSATLAQEPDQTQEGAAAPDAPAGDRAHSPDFDPGGPELELPDEPTPPPEAAPPGEAADPDGPVEQEPEDDVEAPVVDPGDQAPDPGTPPSPPGPAPQPPVEPPTAPAAPPAAPAPAPPAAQAPATAPSPATGEHDAGGPAERPRRDVDERAYRRHRERQARARDQRTPTEVSAPGPPASSVEPAAAQSDFEPVVSAATTETVQPSTARAPEAPAPAAVRERIGRGDHAYVVRAGDCLWSIAADRLGEEAGVAAIAREVDRLWELNRDRVGTGDPDLLMVGTRLTLR